MDFIILLAILILSPLVISLVIVAISMVGFYGYYYYKGKRMIRREKKYKKESVLKRLFWDFPKRFILDCFARDPYDFAEHGLHMFCGEQGSGKTTAIVHKIHELQAKYPLCKVRTNMSFVGENGSIKHWKDLVKNENGTFGQVEVLDEIQTWFSSNQSKNFPPDMITEISQQRKQRKMLIGSAQVFSRIAKPIREQTTFVYLPMTILGCLTIVRVSKPQFWDDEKQNFKRYIKWYFFVHSEKIRNAFDTYKKIEKYSDEGFNPDSIIYRKEA